jgi:Transposase
LNSPDYDYEPMNGIRWTNGDAMVPALFADLRDAEILVTLHLGGTTLYLDEGRISKANAIGATAGLERKDARSQHGRPVGPYAGFFANFHQ